MRKPTISVVIPAYNEERAIVLSLRSLVKQETTYPFEVVVIDNNSTDKTAAVSKKFADRLNIRVIPEKKKGRGAARARGFDEAKGDIIFSTDADTILPPLWIESFTNELKAKDVVAATGTGKISDNTWYKNAIFNIFQPVTMDFYRIFMNHYWLSGFSFAIKRDAYLKAGEIDRTLNALDDIDLSLRVSKLGKIKFVRALPATISGRRFKKNFLKGVLSYGMPVMNVAMNRKVKVYMDDVR